MKTKTLTTIIASIALPVIGLIQGCGSLNPAQEQNLYGLTRWGYDYQMQQERNKAIKESGAKVNVYVIQQDKEDKKITPATKEDVVYLKNGRIIKGEILVEKPNSIYIAEGNENVWRFHRDEIKSYINK